MQTRRRVGLGLILGALLLAAGTPAQAQSANLNCWFNWNGEAIHWNSSVVPVYINVSNDKGVHTSGVDTLSFYLTLENAIATWNEKAGSDLLLEFGGTTTAATLPGAIVVSGGGSACYAKGGKGGVFPLDDTVVQWGDVVIYQWVANNQGMCTGAEHNRTPSSLRLLLEHELGHAMGRLDAYNNPGCGLPVTDHTVMDSSASLTRFDKTQHQAVYGERDGIPELKIMSTSGTWSDHSLALSNVQYAPSGVDSFGTATTLSPFTVSNGDGTTTLKLARSWLLGHYETITLAHDTHESAAASIAADGTAIVAYLLPYPTATQTHWQVCYRVSSDHGATFGPGVCPSSIPGGNQTYHPSVSVAYDHLSKNFVLAWKSSPSEVTLRTVQSGSSTTSQRTKRVDVATERTPKVVCADATSPNSPNCRLIYSDSTRYGQILSWAEFSVMSWWGLILVDTTVHSAGFAVDRDPAVAWFNGQFHLAYTYDSNRGVEHRVMERDGTSWSVVGQLNSSGHVSSPSLSSTRFCFWGCSEVMHLFWLRYD